MFYSIKGKLIKLGPTYAVIEAAGVGYLLTVSGFTRSELAGLGGGFDDSCPEAFLLTHMSVREDGVELFGFTKEEELSVFRMLISVSGIGPKVAMSVLSSMRPEQLALAVSSEDKKAISKCPGIGPKTAARIILELKDKLKNEIAEEAGGEESAAVAPDISSGTNAEAAVEALMVLGFPKSAASAALAGADPSAKVEDLIKLALKKLGRI